MFTFGELHPDYDIPVFNEREVRAASGIVFFFAFLAFMNGWLVGDNEPTKLMITAFFIDFVIRLFINPKYAPSMIAGRWLVNNQIPEYTGAAPKRWAWSIGLILASVMFYLVVLNDVRGPVNILTCSLCLGLLFFESAFGICAGCHLYNLFHKDKAKYCPGGVCETDKTRHEIQQIKLLQMAIVLIFGIFLFFVPMLENHLKSHFVTAKPEKDCTVPQFAIDMGHEEKWKLHNGC